LDEQDKPGGHVVEDWSTQENLGDAYFEAVKNVVRKTPKIRQNIVNTAEDLMVLKIDFATHPFLSCHVCVLHVLSRLLLTMLLITMSDLVSF